ncbi:major facilitator superfamily domain-containing protein [Dichotomocladium elegans]|nr:major facilitator superfamily domain-containing protein [Dichotomocladium elegans]
MIFHAPRLLSRLIGVMQDYYEHRDFPGATIPLSFVGTIANICMNLLGPVSQLMVAMLGVRMASLIAVCLCVLGLECASWSSKIWHLYLTQGFLYGAGASILFYVSMTAVPQWFEKKRGLALGLASTGTCLGSFIMPLLMTALNTHVDSHWCYRILGLIMAVTGVISCLMFRDRADKREERPKLKEVFQLDLLRSVPFLLWCLTDIFMEMSYYVPYFYLPSHATFLGLSSTQGSALISAASAANLIGRLVSGVIADRFGHVNTVILYGICSSLSCFLIWTFSNTFGLLLTFALVFGFFGGSFIALTSSVTVIVTGMDRFQSGLSAFLFITLVSMFGPNAAGALEKHMGASPFFCYKIFAGSGYLAGVLTLFVMKWLISKRLGGRL